MASIASLAVHLITQTTRFVKPLQEAERHVERFSSRTTNYLQKVQSVSKRAGVALAAIKGTVLASTKLAADYASSVADVADQTGLAIESVQQLRYAVEQSGGDFNLLQTGMRAFVRRAAEAAQGNVSFLKGFERLGISQEEVRTGLHDIEGLLMRVADSAAAMGTEAEASAALMTVFGEAGRKLVPFMRQGSAGIRQLMDEAQRLGLIMDTRATRQLSAFGDAISRTQNRFGALSRDMATHFLPALNRLNEFINRGIDLFFNLDEQTKKNIAMLATITGAVLGFVVALGMIATGVSLAVKALGVIGMIFGFLTSPIMLAIAAIVLLYKAWSDNWLGIQDITLAVWGEIKDVWDVVSKPLSVVWEWTARQLGNAWEWLSGPAWEWIKDTAWPVLTSALAAAWTWTAEKAGAAWDWLSGPAWDWIKDTAWPILTSAISTAWEWTAEQAGTAWDWLSGPAWEWIRDTAWPTLTSALSVAWAWTAERVGDAWTWLTGPAWEWIKDTAWPTLTSAISTAWHWTAEKAGDAWEWLSGPAWEWISDTAWPALTNALSVAWQWVAEKTGDAWEWLSGPAWEWIKDTAWPILTSAITTAWHWTAEKAGDAWEWLSGPAWEWVQETAWPKLTTSLNVAWRWTAEKLGTAWDWVMDTLIPWVTGPAWEVLSRSAETTWKWIVDASEGAFQWIKETAWPYIEGVAKTTWQWTVEFAGELWDAIKYGFETGDWSRAIGITAEAWRTGVKIAVALGLAYGTTAFLLQSIRTGLGLTAAAIGSLGLPGAIGVLSVGIALAEAWAKGDYKKFGADLIAALAAGIGIGAFTGSPYAGALAFTIVLNFELGSTLWSSFEEVWEQRGSGRTQLSAPVLFSRAYDDPTSEEYQRRLEQADYIAELVQRVEERQKARVKELAAQLADREFVITAPVELTLWDRIKNWFRGFTRSQDRPPILEHFQHGGYTGNAPVDQIVGVVHGQEIVIPAPAVRKGLPGILEFLGVPGFQSGLLQPIPGLDPQTQAGLSGAQNFLASLSSQLQGIVDLMDRGVESLLNLMEVTLLDAAREVLPEETFAALEERTLALTRTVRQGWQSFKDLFSATEETVDATKDAAAALEDLEAASQRQAALSSFMNALLQRLPIVMAALRGAETGAPFGQIGVVAGALIAVALESEAVAAGFGMVNEMLKAAADALGMLLQPILPLIYVIKTVLTPVFTVLGTILEALLLPIMPILFEGLRWLGIAVLFVAEVFQTVRAWILEAVGSLVYGIGQFIDSLLGWITSVGRNLMKAGKGMLDSADAARKSAQDLSDARQELINLTYEEALERAKNTQELERATEALINVPIGAKVLQRLRWEAATPRADLPGVAVPGVQMAVAGAGVGADTIVDGNYIYIEHMTVQDGQDFEAWLQRHRRREALISTGTTAGMRRV